MIAIPQDIAVVGAGAAGLGVAKHLLARGHRVTVFELGSAVGGLWVYENDSGRSPAYRSLHLNSEARVTGYRDFPIPREAGLYPSHTALRAYLEAYVEEFGLRKHIRFRSMVESVEPIGTPDAPRWRVTVANAEPAEFDRVVVANGHQAEPLHPPFAARFTGEYLHAAQYRMPDNLLGRDVLVVGAGNSGLDIAADVCAATRSTTLSARSPVLVMPRMMLGVPFARVLAKVERPWLPWALRRRAREALTRLVHGRMEDAGFITPRVETHPASHPTLFSHISWGRITVRPGVVGVSGREVRFADGSSAEFDVLIAATGYRVDLPFLAPELRPVDPEQVRLHRRIVHPDHPGLAFIGLFDVNGGGNIRMMDWQCRWLAALVDGDIELPDQDEMIATLAVERRSQTGRPDTMRQALDLAPREYQLQLRAEVTAADERRSARVAVAVE